MDWLKIIEKDLSSKVKEEDYRAFSEALLVSLQNKKYSAFLLPQAIILFNEKANLNPLSKLAFQLAFNQLYYQSNRDYEIPRDQNLLTHNIIIYIYTKVYICKYNNNIITQKDKRINSTSRDSHNPSRLILSKTNLFKESKNLKSFLDSSKPGKIFCHPSLFTWTEKMEFIINELKEKRNAKISSFIDTNSSIYLKQKEEISKQRKIRINENKTDITFLLDYFRSKLVEHRVSIGGDYYFSPDWNKENIPPLSSILKSVNRDKIILSIDWFFDHKFWRDKVDGFRFISRNYNKFTAAQGSIELKSIISSKTITI